MGLVKITKQRVIPISEVDMNRVKKDATNVKFTLIGMDFGVHVADIY
jgi:phage terminase large subunit